MWQALGTLGAAGLEAASAYASNQAKLANQDKVNNININLANTAHQREVNDLRLAGLNPILSAGGQGAASNLASASAELQNPLSGLGNAVNNTFSAKATRALQKGQLANQVASADMQTSSARQMDANTKILEEKLKQEKVNTSIAENPDVIRNRVQQSYIDASPKNSISAIHTLANQWHDLFSSPSFQDTPSAKDIKKQMDFEEKAREPYYKKVKESMQKHPEKWRTFDR